MGKKIVLVAITLPILIIAGFLSMWFTQGLSEEYCQLTRQAEERVQAGDFAAAQQTLTELATKWDKMEPLLQMWICHADTDGVAAHLRGAQAGLMARDTAAFLLESAALTEALEHLHHRDALTWSNLL